MTTTPTPWKICDAGQHANWVPSNHPTIRSGDGRVIASICPISLDPVKRDKDDAAFIVRAVNAHDALVKALFDAKLWINVDDQDADKMIARCDAALNLAKTGVEA